MRNECFNVAVLAITSAGAFVAAISSAIYRAGYHAGYDRGRDDARATFERIVEMTNAAELLRAAGFENDLKITRGGVEWL